MGKFENLTLYILVLLYNSSLVFGTAYIVFWRDKADGGFYWQYFSQRLRAKTIKIILKLKRKNKMSEILYCPKCKNKLECYWLFDGSISSYYISMGDCYTCERPYFQIDCLTENQLSRKTEELESISLNESEAINFFQMLEREPMANETMQQAFKRFLKRKSGNDIDIGAKNKEEWINCSDRQPAKYQHIIGRSIMSGNVEDGFYIKEEVLCNTQGKWHFDLWKPARTDRHVASLRPDKSLAVEKSKLI